MEFVEGLQGQGGVDVYEVTQKYSQLFSPKSFQTTENRDHFFLFKSYSILDISYLVFMTSSSESIRAALPSARVSGMFSSIHFKSSS